MKIANCILLINWLLLISNIMYAQEFITNGSFEKHTTLPKKDGDFNTLKNWFNPSKGFENNFHFGTPDFFHSKASTPVKIPHTKMGTVFPRTGMGLVGLILFTDNDSTIKDFREYIAIPLAKQLIVAKEYQLVFHYSNGILNHYGGYECDEIQVGFSIEKPAQEDNKPLIVDQYFAINNIEFTSSWKKAGLSFTAKSPFNYLIIGNFKNDDLTNCQITPLASSEEKYGYVFIDDVSLKEKQEEKESAIIDTIVEVSPRPPIDTLIAIEPVKEIVKFEEELLTGESIRLNLFFAADSSKVIAPHYPELVKLYSFLLKNTKAVVEIAGHTNGLCGAYYCNKLSKSRAYSIKSYLIKEGIPNTQVVAKGYGKTRPIDTNETVEGRAKNQRVEVKIVEF